ncbi:Hypothetical protein SCF082_LOCUS31282, partial [Durusdinium trenchii]
SFFALLLSGAAPWLDSNYCIAMADAILSRCIDFVRTNEKAIHAAHALESRTFQVELQREAPELWGITWVKEHFAARKRIVQSLVSGGPAARWNAAQSQDSWIIQSGDELVAVNGWKTWEEMAAFKDLVEARLTFVRTAPSPGERGKPMEKASPQGTEGTSKDDVTADVLKPPSFAQGGYLLDASGSGWCATPGGGRWAVVTVGTNEHRDGNLFPDAKKTPRSPL